MPLKNNTFLRKYKNLATDYDILGMRTFFLYFYVFDKSFLAQPLQLCRRLWSTFLYNRCKHYVAEFEPKQPVVAATFMCLLILHTHIIVFLTNLCHVAHKFVLYFFYFVKFVSWFVMILARMWFLCKYFLGFKCHKNFEMYDLAGMHGKYNAKLFALQRSNVFVNIFS